MGGEPLFALPPRVLVAGRLQCGAARAGVRRGRGECAELAHLAPRLHDWFYARHAEKCPFFSGVGRNTILAMWLERVVALNREIARRDRARDTQAPAALRESKS
mgnify:CR=1 FL=1